ncbi:hypothetical protein N7451_012308 [Penicillium sp. IBT 35674x]|nr:hypothetical protein N7451_012308 [Penicillium sp. IBT 35674x]
MRSGTIYSYNSLSFGTLEGIRKVIVVIGYGTLVLTALNAIAIIAILITLLVKYNSPVDSEFSLYKNTRFKECAAVQPDAANCSAISASYERDSTYSHYADLGRFYIVGSEQASYEWCQMRLILQLDRLPYTAGGL